MSPVSITRASPVAPRRNSLYNNTNVSSLINPTHSMPSWKRYLAELLGTFLFIFMGIGTYLAFNQNGGVSIIGVAITHGIGLALAVYIFGHVSGAHVNPAVTFALWVTKKIRTIDGIAYIIAQLAGAILAALAAKTIYGDMMIFKLGTPELGPTVTTVTGIITEALLTFFLVWTIFAVAIDRRNISVMSGLVIGLALTADIFAGGVVSGAAVNPARWFGPALIAGQWTNWYVYIVGPLLGALLAGLIYQGVFLQNKE